NRDAGAIVDALVTAPGLPGLRNLVLDGELLDRGCDLMAASSLLPRLRLLRFSSAMYYPGELLRLASAVAATPHCRLSLTHEVEEVRAILGERFIVEWFPV